MIRGIRPEDLAALKTLHKRMGFGYPFPDLKIQDVGLVATNWHDKPMMAALAVPIVDCYLLIDPEATTPGARWETFKQLHQAMREELQKRGYRWAQADIPPQIDRSFGKRLNRLGWIKSEWPCWAAEI